MAFFDWDLGNGKVWKIPLEDSKPKRRIFKIKHTIHTEAEQARESMRQYYTDFLKKPVPAEEEEFAAAMIEAEKNPVESVIQEPIVHDDDYIPPMPEYGTKDFFIWCSKTKKAREALKKKKEDEKAAAVAAKAAAKLAKDAAKAEKEASKAAKAADKAATKAIKAAAKNGGK